MYGTSTQYKNWTFKDELQLSNFRKQANQSFIEKFSKEHDATQIFLSSEEEQLLVKYYEISLKEFCNEFQYPEEPVDKLPSCVLATAQHYFKRFYLHNSVMDYHPKDIMVSCVFIACKTEEFYITMNEFVSNVKGDQEKAAEFIINNEFLLMENLKFNLIIHHPFRPLQGLFIHLKTKFKDLENPDRLSKSAEEFLETALLTDAVLLFSPSQIALAAAVFAASKLRENLDKYISDILFKDAEDHLPQLTESVIKIKIIVKNYNFELSEDRRKEIEKKLETCRNP